MPHWRSGFILGMQLVFAVTGLAGEPVPRLMTAQGTIEAIEPERLTLQLHVPSGKRAEHLVLGITSSSRFAALAVSERGGRVAIAQEAIERKALKQRQHVAVIYTNQPDGPILLSAVVETMPAGELEKQAAGELPAGVPAKVATVLKFIDENDKAPEGYEGGRTFHNAGRNGEESLPRKDSRGRTITYREWDVNPHVPGKNRGAERLITGSDGSAYYTADHYRTFKKVR